MPLGSVKLRALKAHSRCRDEMGWRQRSVAAQHIFVFLPQIIDDKPEAPAGLAGRPSGVRPSHLCVTSTHSKKHQTKWCGYPLQSFVIQLLVRQLSHLPSPQCFRRSELHKG